MDGTSPPAWAARIRAERRRRLWDVHTMARRLRRAAGEERRSLPGHDSLVRSIRRWESGRIGALSERYRLLYCQAFGLPERVLFGGPPPREAPPLQEAPPPPLRLLIAPDLLPLLRDTA